MKENEEKLLEQIVLTHVMRLSLLVNGIAVGLLFGLGLFLTTIFLVLKGGPVVGPHLGLLGQFLPGYAVTLTGSFVGLGYGLVLGFILGAFVAFVYNRVADYRDALQQRRTRK